MQATTTRRINRFVMTISIAAFAVGITVTPAMAQEQKTGGVVWSVVKSVALDPTTYVPASLSYTSQRMDWNTSQPLFNAGWVEHNDRFTVSGRPDDRPISYEAGNQQIRRDALLHLQQSLVNNFSAQIFERVLTEKYPEHRKLLKTVSWIERIGFSAYVGYLASADHFRQVQRNRATAAGLGLPQR